MKNNKGFTIIELLVSFVLSMIIITIMFQLILNLKDVFQTSSIKTDMLNKQNLMINKIYSDLLEKKLMIINQCGLDCISFTFTDGTTKELYANIEKGYLTYDNYTIKLNNQSYFTNVKIENNGISKTDKSNKVLSINIPIYNNLFKNENFGINIVYLYNSKDITNNYN